MKRFIFLLVLIFAMGFFILYNKEEKKEILPVSQEYIEIQENDVIVYNSMHLIAKMEGLELKPYKGLGHKEYAICYGNSFGEYKRRFKTSIGIKENCDIMLKEKIEKIFDDIKEDGFYLEDNLQYVSLISLAYNLRGNYNAIKGTNLYQHLQHGQNIDGIIEEWLDFSHVKGEVVVGLLKRNAYALKVFFLNFPQEQKEYAYAKISYALSNYNVYKDMNLRIYE